MWLVWKSDERHFTGFFHHDVKIDDLDFGFRENIGSRLDVLFAQGPDPGDLVTDAILGQQRERIGRFLQDANGWAERVRGETSAEPIVVAPGKTITL